MKNGKYKSIQLFPRVSMNGRVYIHNDHSLFIAPLGNISEGGIFIDRMTAIPCGDRVRLVIKATNFKAPLQAKGKVIRVNHHGREGLAVEFTTLSAFAKHAIQSCVPHSRHGDKMREERHA